MPLSVLKSLGSSEKAIFCIALIAAASVLTAMGYMTVAEWQDYTKWLAGIYVAGKAIEGAASKVAGAVTAKSGKAAKEK